jgi:hypothetical protein
VLAVAVVLTDEDDRELPHGGHVQRLVKGADVRCAIAEVGHGHVLLAPELRGEREAVGDRHAAADDTGGHHHATGRVRDVHRPPLSLAGAGDLAGDLRPQQFRRQSLGKHVVHAAVDRADRVLVGEIHRDGRGNRLLPARRIVGRDDLAGLDHRSEAVIAALDQRHSTVYVDEDGSIDPGVWCHGDLV